MFNKILKGIIWLIAILGGMKFLDHYIFPIVRPGRPMVKILKEIEKHYILDPSTLHPNVASKYVKLTADDETLEFLENCRKLQSRLFAYIGQSIVYTYLKPL